MERVSHLAAGSGPERGDGLADTLAVGRVALDAVVEVPLDDEVRFALNGPRRVLDEDLLLGTRERLTAARLR